MAPGSGAVEAGPGQLPSQPGNDVVEPLKLGQDQDATPVLEEKSPDQLLAIRKATARQLAERSREQGPWASGQARLLRQGLRALDAHLKARGIETVQPNTKPRRRSRGFEF